MIFVWRFLGNEINKKTYHRKCWPNTTKMSEEISVKAYKEINKKIINTLAKILCSNDNFVGKQKL